MTQSTKTCLLFTQSFPYGESEVFLESEINYLASYFEKVIVFPLNASSNHIRPLPKNVSVKTLFNISASVNFSLKDLLSILKIIIFELKFQTSNMLKHFRGDFSFLKSEYKKAKIVKDYLSDNLQLSQCVLYSYWFDTWVLILSIIKKNSFQNIKFYSRAHGFDIFKEQTKNKYHPFKNFMLNNVNSVYSVSNAGLIYLKNNYKDFSEKIKLSYLGSPYHIFNDKEKKQQLVIVTCANIRAIKRIEYVPEILEQLPHSFNVKWILIGEGEKLIEIKNKCKRLNNNVECVFTEYLIPEKILEFYSMNRVDLFLSVSKSEGIPYTMIEAISFGIPILSTDVGGCSEICNNQTGILIAKDFDTKDVANKIVEFSNSQMNTIEFRKGVRRFWEEHFNAENNYYAFYSTLTNEEQ